MVSRGIGTGFIGAACDVAEGHQDGVGTLGTSDEGPSSFADRLPLWHRRIRVPIRRNGELASSRTAIFGLVNPFAFLGVAQGRPNQAFQSGPLELGELTRIPPRNKRQTTPLVSSGLCIPCRFKSSPSLEWTPVFSSPTNERTRRTATCTAASTAALTCHAVRAMSTGPMPTFAALVRAAQCTLN